MKVCEKVQYSRSGVITDDERRNYIRESGVMLHCSKHINIVNYIGLVLREMKPTPDNAGSRIKYAIVSEYCPRGSLDELLYGKRKTHISIRRKLLMLLDAARGLSHLHDDMISIIHRDLAARNLLVSADWTIKITDFGLSRFLKKKKEKAQESFVDITQNKTVHTDGPIKWMAPEAIMLQTYSRASDMWMFGITTWEIFHESPPYKGEDPVAVGVAVVKDKRRLAPLLPPEDIRPRDDMKPFSRERDWEVLIKMMRDCWQENPKDRLTTDQIVTVIENCLKENFVKVSKYGEIIGQKTQLSCESSNWCDENLAMDFLGWQGEEKGYQGRKVIRSLPAMKFGQSSKSQKGLLKSPGGCEIELKSWKENEWKTRTASLSASSIVLPMDCSQVSLDTISPRCDSAPETNYDNIIGYEKLQPIHENSRLGSHLLRQESANDHETSSGSAEILNKQSNNVKVSRQKRDNLEESDDVEIAIEKNQRVVHLF